MCLLCDVLIDIYEYVGSGIVVAAQAVEWEAKSHCEVDFNLDWSGGNFAED